MAAYCVFWGGGAGAQMRCADEPVDHCSVELKGAKDEVRTFHINPWGNVMPFGGPGRRAG